MSLISLIFLIVFVGVLLWAANTYIPMDAKVKNILNIVVIVALVLFILNLFISPGDFPDIKVGR